MQLCSNNTKIAIWKPSSEIAEVKIFHYEKTAW